MHPKDIVRTGYDSVSYTYRGDIEDVDCAEYHQWLDELMPLLSAGTPVLDLGCGCGLPVAKRLAPIHRVTGVDISPVQIQRARQLVPQAHFLCTDMLAVDFPPAHFEAIVSFYATFMCRLPNSAGCFTRCNAGSGPGGM